LAAAAAFLRTRGLRLTAHPLAGHGGAARGRGGARTAVGSGGDRGGVTSVNGRLMENPLEPLRTRDASSALHGQDRVELRSGEAARLPTLIDAGESGRRHQDCARASGDLFEALRAAEAWPAGSAAGTCGAGRCGCSHRPRRCPGAPAAERSPIDGLAVRFNGGYARAAPALNTGQLAAVRGRGWRCGPARALAVDRSSRCTRNLFDDGHGHALGHAQRQIGPRRWRARRASPPSNLLSCCAA